MPTTLTSGQLQVMALHVANDLRARGVPVTPETVERELERRVAAHHTLRTAAGCTPPNPYEHGLAKMRADLPSNRWPEPRPTPTTPSDVPPNPYEQGLEKMRRETR